MKYIVLVKPSKYKEPLWLGNIDGNQSKEKVKLDAIALVRKHFDLDIAKIVRIARGEVTIIIDDPKYDIPV